MLPGMALPLAGAGMRKPLGHGDLPARNAHHEKFTVVASGFSLK